MAWHPEYFLSIRAGEMTIDNILDLRETVQRIQKSQQMTSSLLVIHARQDYEGFTLSRPCTNCVFSEAL